MAEGKTKFVVIDGNRLCYIDPRLPEVAYTLATSVLLGATYGSENATFDLTLEKDVRPATRLDFVTFRVSWQQFAHDNRYEFPAS